jgi:outer membrane protein assembly factor BamB
MYNALSLNSLNGKIPMIAGQLYPEGIYLVKYDLAGKVIWARQQSFHAIPTDMGADVNGMIYVLYATSGGPMLGKYDPDGNPLPHPYPPGSNPSFDNFNNLFMTGFHQVRKFDLAGTLMWSKNAQEDAQLTVEKNGKSYISTAFYAFKSGVEALRSDGTSIWNIDLPVYSRVAPAIEGENLYVTGSYGNNQTAEGVQVYKLNASTGAVKWSMKVPCDYTDITCITSFQGNVYVSFQGWANEAAYIARIEDLSYSPVTTSLAVYSKQNNLLLSPNPCNGAFTFRYSAGQYGKIRINIRDATGRSVLSRDFAAFSNEVSETINIASLPPGMYVFELQNGDAGMVRKLVVQ